MHAKKQKLKKKVKKASNLSHTLLNLYKEEAPVIQVTRTEKRM